MLEVMLYMAPAFGIGVVLLWSSNWKTALSYALLMAFTVFGALEVMGTPKPIWSEWREIDGDALLGAHYVPGFAIYVWAGGEVPRVYRLPWSEKTAKELQDAARKGLPYMMSYRNRDFEVHPAPQIPSPEKDVGTE